jgi:hypothetical protein
VNTLVWTLTFCVLVSALVLAHLLRVRHRLRKPQGTFGEHEKSRARSLGSEIILRELLRQQRWSFTLVWISAVLALVLVVILIVRFLSGATPTLRQATAVLALVADFSVFWNGYRLYKDASTRLERLPAFSHLAKADDSSQEG